MTTAGSTARAIPTRPEDCANSCGMSRNAAARHHKAGDGNADQVRQKKQKRSLRDLVGETRHRSTAKHSNHFRAEREADAADTERWHKGDSNRHPGNRIRQLFSGHLERPGNGRRDGDAQINQVGDVRPVISDYK